MNNEMHCDPAFNIDSEELCFGEDEPADTSDTDEIQVGDRVYSDWAGYGTVTHVRLGIESWQDTEYTVQFDDSGVGYVSDHRLVKA